MVDSLEQNQQHPPTQIHTPYNMHLEVNKNVSLLSGCAVQLSTPLKMNYFSSGSFPNIVGWLHLHVGSL